MTTNLDIIKRAMKKIHVLASGAEPTAAEATDGMGALQSLIVELIGQGSLGRLNDVLATSAYTAREFDRVQASHGIVVTIPTTITPALEPCGGAYDYGFRCGSVYSDTRPPRDRACIILVQDNEPTYHVFRSTTNEWVEINDLDKTDAFPFADYLEDGFACLLAERIVDLFDGGQVGAETKRAANVCRSMLSMKPDSASQRTQGEYF